MFEIIVIIVVALITSLCTSTLAATVLSGIDTPSPWYNRLYSTMPRRILSTLFALLWLPFVFLSFFKLIFIVLWDFIVKGKLD